MKSSRFPSQGSSLAFSELLRVVSLTDCSRSQNLALATVVARARSRNYLSSKDRAREKLQYIFENLGFSASATSKFFGENRIVFSVNDRMMAHAALRLYGRYRHSPSSIRKIVSSRHLVPQVRSQKLSRSTSFPLFSLTLKGITVLRGTRSAIAILPMIPAFRSLLYAPWLDQSNLPFLADLHILVSDVMLIGAFRHGELLLADSSLDAAVVAIKLKHIEVEGLPLVDDRWGIPSVLALILRVLSSVSSADITYGSINLPRTKTQTVLMTKVYLTPGLNSELDILPRFLKSLNSRVRSGEELHVNSPAFGFPDVIGDLVVSKFFSLAMFREIDIMLMEPFNGISQMSIIPYSRRKGWASILTSLGNDLLMVRILLRHSIGCLKHYVKMKAMDIVKKQEEVLRLWDSGKFDCVDMSLSALIELSEIAVDGDDFLYNVRCLPLRLCPCLTFVSFFMSSVFLYSSYLQQTGAEHQKGNEGCSEQTPEELDEMKVRYSFG